MTIYDPMEMAVKWAASICECPVSTYVRDDAQDNDVFITVERTGGIVDYPHDSPEITFRVWATSDATAEENAYLLAIAAKTMPPSDAYVNAVGAPTMYSYGREDDGDYYMWDVSIPFNIRLQ